MPTFTRKLSDIIESGFNLGLSIEDYPIFDETYRNDLNKKILDHYMNYEIGQETESMFRFALNRKMREIMPYYNQLYKSTQIQFDPLQTMNFTDVTDSNNTATGSKIDEASNNNTSDNKSRTVASETPQVKLSQDGDYATAASDGVSHSTVEGTATTSESHTDNLEANSTRTLLGSQGIASELLMTYRQSLLNIDMSVITDLETLFMQIWDNGDEFTPAGLEFGYGYGYAFGYYGLF